MDTGRLALGTDHALDATGRRVGRILPVLTVFVSALVDGLAVTSGSMVYRRDGQRDPVDGMVCREILQQGFGDLSPLKHRLLSLDGSIPSASTN